VESQVPVIVSASRSTDVPAFCSDWFIELAKRIGSSRHGNDRVVWRFDPFLLLDSLTPRVLLDRIERIGERIVPHTPRLVFSFIDIKAYAKVARNLERAGIRAREFGKEEMLEVGAGVARRVKGWCIFRWPLTASTMRLELRSPKTPDNNNCAN